MTHKNVDQGRRNHLVTLLSASVLSNTVGIPIARAAQVNDNKNVLYNSLRFDDQLFADRHADGYWNIQGRLGVTGKYRLNKIPVTLDVATDQIFSQIVETSTWLVGNPDPYIFSHRYKNRYPGTILYARLSAERIVARVDSQTNTKSHYSKVIYSNAIKLEP